MNEAVQQQKISTDTPARSNGEAVSISPEEFIRKIRKIFGRYPDFSGGCLKFHRLLKDIFPNVNGWYNGEHIISEIEGEFYDIDGKARRTASFQPLTDQDLIAFRDVYTPGNAN